MIIDYRSDEYRTEGFIQYVKHAKSTWDIDPSTLIIPHLFDIYKLDREQRYWFCFLYRTTYSTPGAYQIFKKFPDPHNIDQVLFKKWYLDNLKHIPISHDRWRQKYQNPDAVSRYLELSKNSQHEFFMNHLPQNDKDPIKNFHNIWEVLHTIPSFGLVTNFNYCETLNRIMHLNIDTDTMFFPTHWKPMKGANFIYNGLIEGADPVLLEQVAKELLVKTNKQISINNLLLGRCLCLYAGLVIGNRYYGYYYDRNLEECTKLAKIEPELSNEIMKIRQKIAPKHLLGELNDWSGRRKHLLKVFQQTGQLANIDYYPTQNNPYNAIPQIL